MTAVALAAAVLAFVAAAQMRGSEAIAKEGVDATYSSRISHDQAYFVATDPLGGPAQVAALSYEEH